MKHDKNTLIQHYAGLRKPTRSRMPTYSIRDVTLTENRMTRGRLTMVLSSSNPQI